MIMHSVNRQFFVAPIRIRVAKSEALFASPLLPRLILGFGVIVRCVQYLANRSLWLDESMLALNITHRTFTQLLQPLDYDQGAPFAFLIIERAFVQLLGNSEYALRLFPLLAGIIGAMAIWTSHPSFFVLTGTGIVLTWFYLRRKEWGNIRRLAIACAFWVLNFAVLYFISLRHLATNDVLLDYWARNFMPLAPF